MSLLPEIPPGAICTGATITVSTPGGDFSVEMNEAEVQYYQRTCEIPDSAWLRAMLAQVAPATTRSMEIEGGEALNDEGEVIQIPPFTAEWI